MTSLGLISVGVRGFLGATGVTCLVLMVYLSGRDAAWRKWLLGSAYAVCWVLVFAAPAAMAAVGVMHGAILVYVAGYYVVTGGDTGYW